MQIAGKTALVTGAAGALGSRIVAMLREAGANEVLMLDKVAIQGGIVCDVTDASALEKALLPHKIDILVNNAGILYSAPLVQMAGRDEARFSNAASVWREVIDANLSSAFYVTQIVADVMAKARVKGVIVNISSVSAKGTAGQSAYAASKAGINALTQVWAKELGVLGIRSVAVAPGYMDTPSTHKALSETQLQAIADRVPLKRLGEAEHIVKAVRFAIENDYVNGAVLEVDGGLSV